MVKIIITPLSFDEANKGYLHYDDKWTKVLYPEEFG
jgi:hypothetical protein